MRYLALCVMNGVASVAVWLLLDQLVFTVGTPVHYIDVAIGMIGGAWTIRQAQQLFPTLK